MALHRIDPALPQGWGELLRQVAIWLGFVLAYQIARRIADLGPAEAFRRFVDTLATSEALNHGSSVVELAANPSTVAH